MHRANFGASTSANGSLRRERSDRRIQSTQDQPPPQGEGLILGQTFKQRSTQRVTCKRQETCPEPVMTGEEKKPERPLVRWGPLMEDRLKAVLRTRGVRVLQQTRRAS